jgi:hypothetical protein
LNQVILSSNSQLFTVTEQTLRLLFSEFFKEKNFNKWLTVTNPLCPPSNQAEDGSIAALQRHARDFAHQQMTRDSESGISYLESADSYEYDMLAIRRMIAQ